MPITIAILAEAVVVATAWYFYNRGVSWEWDRLRSYLDNNVVKASVIAPIIGYFLIFNPTVATYISADLAQHIQSGNLAVDLNGRVTAEGIAYHSTDSISALRPYFYYFGLTFLGVASMAYIGLCPLIIHRFTSAEEYGKYMASDLPESTRNRECSELPFSSMFCREFVRDQLAQLGEAVKMSVSNNNKQDIPIYRLETHAKIYNAYAGSGQWLRIFIVGSLFNAFLLLALPTIEIFFRVCGRFWTFLITS